MAVQKQDDQHEHTFSSYVRIRDVVLKTYLGRWTIGRSGERGSGISVLPAQYDDDNGWYAIKPNPPLHFGEVAIEKGAFWSPSTTVTNFTYFLLTDILPRPFAEKHRRIIILPPPNLTVGTVFFGV